MEQPDSYEYPTLSICFLHGANCDTEDIAYCVSTARVRVLLGNGLNDTVLEMNNYFANITAVNEVNLGWQRVYREYSSVKRDLFILLLSCVKDGEHSRRTERRCSCLFSTFGGISLNRSIVLFIARVFGTGLSTACGDPWVIDPSFMGSFHSSLLNR